MAPAINSFQKLEWRQSENTRIKNYRPTAMALEGNNHTPDMDGKLMNIIVTLVDEKVSITI